MARKGTLLVVDDDPYIVAMIKQALEDEGYQVLASVDGEALQVAHDRQPDLILLDLMMPIMDGVEVSQRLRADPATASIPLVAMSATRRLKTTADLLPGDDQLAKPFNLERLFATVARWIPAS